MGLFKKKAPNYRVNADWDVYFQDQQNGMPFSKQQEKLMSGGYAKGVAMVDNNYGRIDDVDKYKRDKKEYSSWIVEYRRQTGYYMKK